MSADSANETRLIGESPVFRAAMDMARQVAPLDVPVLIEGETGTGKDLLSRWIHEHSKRRQAPFVAVNCGAIPESLLEAELFGAEKGSFTGSDRDRPGHFQLADGGTIFLDEIGEASPAFQVKLLRTLQVGEIHRVGASSGLKVDVRVIAACNVPLKDLVDRGAFRKDLFYRVAVYRIELPPLRRRREDIPALAEHLVAEVCRRCGWPRSAVSREVLDILVNLDFPGNVRQLESLLTHALIVANGGEVELRHLPGEISGAKPDPRQVAVSVPRTRAELLEAKNEARRQLERLFVTEALRRAGGNVTKAAREAGYRPPYLFNLMKKCGISPLANEGAHEAGRSAHGSPAHPKPRDEQAPQA